MGYTKSYLLAMMITLFSVNYSFSQFQINASGSAYGIALNKNDIYYNPYGEKSSYYERSQYLTLGLGYKFQSGLFFCVESSAQKLFFNGTSFNPFANFPETGTSWLRSKYKLDSYSSRIGLRTGFTFFNSHRLRLVISGSAQLMQEWLWIENGTNSLWVDGESQEELYTRTFKTKENHIYYDFRIGLEYRLSEHLFLTISSEFSTGLLNPYHNNHGTHTLKNNGRVRKHEYARPFSIKYLF